MTFEKARDLISSRSFKPWMASAIYKINDEYAIASTSYIKRFPNKKYVWMRKGEMFPTQSLIELEKLEM